RAEEQLAPDLDSDLGDADLETVEEAPVAPESSELTEPESAVGVEDHHRPVPLVNSVGEGEDLLGSEESLFLALEPRQSDVVAGGLREQAYIDCGSHDLREC